MKKSGLPKKLLGQTLLRSFLLQASWNFERLQSLGALYTIAPALRYIYRDRPEELALAYRRHLGYFNTHPFMASPVLGAIVALEEGGDRGDGRLLGAQEFKEMIIGPYAAMGDALFWGGIRPLAAGVALFLAVRESFWAPVVFLVFFNIPHLWMRVFGLVRGYTLGLKIVEVIQRRRLPDLAIRLKEGTVVLLGGLSGYLTFLCLRQEGWSAGWGLGVIPSVLFLGWLARKGVSSLMLILGVSTLTMALVQLH